MAIVWCRAAAMLLVGAEVLWFGCNTWDSAVLWFTMVVSAVDVLDRAGDVILPGIRVSVLDVKPRSRVLVLFVGGYSKRAPSAGGCI